jgi:hypothetical protein
VPGQCGDGAKSASPVAVMDRRRWSRSWSPCSHAQRVVTQVARCRINLSTALGIDDEAVYVRDASTLRTGPLLPVQEADERTLAKNDPRGGAHGMHQNAVV